MKRTYVFLMALALSASGLTARDPDLLKRNKTAPEGIMRSGIGRDGRPMLGLKMNLTQLLISGISLQAEFAFHRNMSLALGASYLPKRTVPDVIYDLSKNAYSSYFSKPVFEARTITPEFRFYPFGRAPAGFYLSAYLQYAHYMAHQTVSYQDISSPGAPTYSALATHDYAGTTGGLMIGKQWIIARHLSIDLWIMGGGYGKAKYTYSWQVDGIDLTPDQQELIKNQAAENFGTFKMVGVTPAVETTSNSVLMSAMIPMISVRFMGLCVGFAF